MRPRRARAIGSAALLALGISLMIFGARATAQQQAPAPPASEAPASPTPAAPPAVELPREPKALDILQASSRRLAAARTMSFTAVVSYESPDWGLGDVPR